MDRLPGIYRSASSIALSALCVERITPAQILENGTDGAAQPEGGAEFATTRRR
ncbi:MAG: hypothetical protein ACP5O0_05885 [Acidimicrobiales bacterium]